MTLVRLVADDGGKLELWVPLDADGHFDAEGIEPWLFKGRWDRTLYHGELSIVDGHPVLQWNQIDGPEYDQTPIDDLLRVAVSIGRVFTLRSRNTGEKKEFRVVEMTTPDVPGARATTPRPGTASGREGPK